MKIDLEGRLTNGKCWSAEVDWPAVPRVGEYVAFSENGDGSNVEEVLWDQEGKPLLDFGVTGCPFEQPKRGRGKR